MLFFRKEVLTTLQLMSQYLRRNNCVALYYGGPQGSLRIILQHISNYEVRISNYAQHIPNSSTHILNSLQILKSSQHISKSSQHISKSSQHISNLHNTFAPGPKVLAEKKETVTQLLLPSMLCFVPRVENLCKFRSN